MLDALQIGLSGMQAAQTATAARARNITNVNTKGYVPVEPVTQSTDGGVKTSVKEQSAQESSLSPEMLAALGNVPESGVDLPSELINLRLAEIAYKASAKVVETANEMADVALKATK